MKPISRMEFAGGISGRATPVTLDRMSVERKSNSVFRTRTYPPQYVKKRGALSPVRGVVIALALSTLFWIATALLLV